MIIPSTDTVDLLKKDGSKIEKLKATVQRTKIFMDAGKTPIESGDLVLRKMSNGGEETYKVIDPVFYEIPTPHYQIRVKKLGVPEAEHAIQSITYNISGSNARINQNSTDNSTNVVNIDTRAIHYIQEIRNELEKLDLSNTSRQNALEVLDEVSVQIQSGSPKKSVMSALLSSLPHVANITSIVSALVALF